MIGALGKIKAFAMKTSNRPQSQNVIDHRNFFGTDALDPNYSLEDQQADFVRAVLSGSLPTAPQQIAPPTEIDRQIKTFMETLGQTPQTISVRRVPLLSDFFNGPR